MRNQATVARLPLFLTLALFALCGSYTLSTAAEPGSAAVASAEAAAGVAAATEEEAKKEEEAKRQAEFKAHREQERQELLEGARDMADSADRHIVENLPAPLKPLFGTKLFGITLWRYLTAAAVVAAGFVALLTLRRRIRRSERRVEKGECSSSAQKALNITLIALRNPAKLILLALVLRGVSHLLVTRFHPDIIGISNLFLFMSVVLFFFDLVGILDRTYGDALYRSAGPLMGTVRPMLVMGLRLLIILFAGLHIYQGLTGRTMVSLVAGLGIGGLAVALASQETLKNLMGFASIAFDKAFLVGDTVIIGDIEGVVEHVGMRSTHIRSVEGNLVIVPNANAVSANVVNKTRPAFMRREVNLYLSPLNPYDKVKRAVELVRLTLDGQEGKLPGLRPTVRFVSYEPARFVIQAYFWYDAGKDGFYDEASRLNLEILRRFSEAGILFAER